MSTQPNVIRVAAGTTRIIDFFQEFALAVESMIITNESSNKAILVKWNQQDAIQAQIPPGQFRAYDGVAIRWMSVTAPDDGAAQIQWISKEVL